MRDASVVVDKTVKTAFMIAHFHVNSCREIEGCFVREIMSLTYA